MGKFEMSLERIRTEFGLPESYHDLSNLKTCYQSITR